MSKGRPAVVGNSTLSGGKMKMNTRHERTKTKHFESMLTKLSGLSKPSRILWTNAEDQLLTELYHKNGEKNWTVIANQLAQVFPNERTGKSCRLRWKNQLSDTINHEPWEQWEKDLIKERHGKIGSSWSVMAKELVGRTDNQIKNLWNSSLKEEVRREKASTESANPTSSMVALHPGGMNNLSSMGFSETTWPTSPSYPALATPPSLLGGTDVPSAGSAYAGTEQGMEGMLHSTRALSLTGGASSEAYQLSGNQIIPYSAVNVPLKHEWQPSYASGRICDDEVVIAPPNLKFEPDFPHPASARPVGTTLPARQAPPLGQTFPLRDSHLFSGDLSALNSRAFCKLTASLRAQGHEVPQPMPAIQAELCALYLGSVDGLATRNSWGYGGMLETMDEDAGSASTSLCYPSTPADSSYLWEGDSSAPVLQQHPLL